MDLEKGLNWAINRTNNNSSSNKFYSYNNTYLKTSLIKILGILIKNSILYLYILIYINLII